MIKREKPDHPQGRKWVLLAARNKKDRRQDQRYRR